MLDPLSVNCGLAPCHDLATAPASGVAGCPLIAIVRCLLGGLGFAVMSNMSSRSRLRLPSLTIRGFRGIDSLTLQGLGRVTLLAGRNGIGKTTVLDAVRLYAAGGREQALVELLEGHEEFLKARDEDGDPYELPDLTALFYGRDAGSTPISVGPNGDRDALRLELSPRDEWPNEFEEYLARFGADPALRAIKVRFKDGTTYLPWPATPNGLPLRVHRSLARLRGDDDLPDEIPCHSVGPNLLSNDRLAGFWDDVALEPEEELALDALRLVLGPQIDRVAVVSSEYRHFERRIVVRLGSGKRVPLASLGDGAARMFGMALALAGSRGGFLVIDEAENGIHYSILQDFWRLVLKAAREYRVQILATTHSKDCIHSFGRAAVEFGGMESVLFRLERRGGELRAVRYPQDQIETAAEQDIETR